MDIETFPTLLIANGASPRFFGPVPPSLAQLARLLASLRESDSVPELPEASALLARLGLSLLSDS